MFLSLSDPADVVTVLLSDAISCISTDFLQDRGSNVVRHSKISGVTRCAHPAEWAKAQRENVTVAKAKAERSQKSLLLEVFKVLLEGRCQIK